MSSKSGNPQQKRYHGSGNRENISQNMDDMVSKVEPLKPISCGHCGKPGHIIKNLTIKVRIVELPRISCKKTLNPQV